MYRPVYYLLLVGRLVLAGAGMMLIGVAVLQRNQVPGFVGLSLLACAGLSLFLSAGSSNQPKIDSYGRQIFERSRAKLLGWFSFLAVVLSVSIVYSVGLLEGLARPRSLPEWPAMLLLILLIPFLGNAAIKALRRNVDITLGADGVCDGISLFGLIPWQDIADVELIRRRQGQVLILNVRNFERYDDRHKWRRLFLLNDAFGESRQVMLNLIGLKGDPGYLLSAIKMEIDARRQRRLP
jgi:hypothetical protein